MKTVGEILDIILNLETIEGAAKVREACKRYIMRKTYAGQITLPRKPLGEAKKRKLFGAQHGLCARCHDPKKYEELTDDHFVPIAKAGSNRFSNRRLVCEPCNKAKGAREPIDDAKALGETLAQQMPAILNQDSTADDL